MEHRTHGKHDHVHDDACGHTRIAHNGHVDYVHDGHLHSAHGGHYDEHVLEVNDQNPTDCAPVNCAGGHNESGHETVPHGDHEDYIVNGRLHHRHGDHCDDHGPVKVLA